MNRSKLLYVPTRYPNGFEDSKPADDYTDADSRHSQFLFPNRHFSDLRLAQVRVFLRIL